MTDLTTRIAALEAAEAKATPGPWSYRPEEYDDWGVVRAGLHWIGQIKDSRFVDADYLNQCRREKRDPWEANAALIVSLRNNALAIIREQQAEIARLQEVLSKIDRMRPVTCDMSLAHEMADIAEAALNERTGA